MNKITLSVLLVSLSLMLAGCAEQQGSAERAGEKIDKGIQNSKDAVSDAIENAGDKIGDATDRY